MVRGVRPIATSTCSATTRPPSERASTAFCSVRWAAVTSTPCAHRDPELRRATPRPARPRTAPCSRAASDAHEQRDLGAEARVGGGHLGRDDAAADHGERGRDRLRAGRIAAGPRLDLAQTRDVGQQRRRSGRHRDGVPRDELGHRAVLGRHPHALDARELGVPADQVDAGLRRASCTCDAVVPVVGDAIAATQHAGDVDVAGDRLLRAVDVARRAQRRRAAQQPLGRHARPVRALAADQLGLDDDGASSRPARCGRRRSRPPPRLRSR